jgi:hypothetical protein
MLKPCPPVSGSRAIGRPRRGSASMGGGSHTKATYTLPAGVSGQEATPLKGSCGLQHACPVIIGEARA